MKQPKNFHIGIDFSKKTFDATVVSPHLEGFQPVHQKFDNTKKGFDELIRWVRTSTGLKGRALVESVTLCGENTGSYSEEASEYLSRKGWKIWLADALDIKNATSGRNRSKNDKIDSLIIAMYLYRYIDQAKWYVPLSDVEVEMRELLQRHVALTHDRTKLKNRIIAKAQTFARTADLRKVLISDRELIKVYEKQIASNDKALEQCMVKAPEYAKNYQILISFKGVGLITAAAILVYTRNFTRFGFNFRALASYAGVCPLHKKSGTSIDSPDRVSKLCNRTLKGILSNATNSAIQSNPAIRTYAERLFGRGKTTYIIRNNVSYKILKILCYMVQNQTKWDPEYQKNHTKQTNDCSNEKNTVSLPSETQEETGSAEEQPASNKSPWYAEKAASGVRPSSDALLFQTPPHG